MQWSYKTAPLSANKKLPAAAIISWSVVNKATTWTHQGNKLKGEKNRKLNTRVMLVCVTLNISGKSNLETRIRLLGANAWAGWIRPSSSSSSSPSPCSVFVPWKINRCEISEGSTKGQVYLTTKKKKWMDKNFFSQKPELDIRRKLDWTEVMFLLFFFFCNEITEMSF